MYGYKLFTKFALTSTKLLFSCLMFNESRKHCRIVNVCAVHKITEANWNYMASGVTCLLALTASASADAPWGGLVYAPKHASVDYYAYPRYAFEYSVKDPHTGDNKAQWEMRDGDVVKGSYSLVEPGGSVRIVDYWADSKSGFNANVRRIGAKVHPTMVAAAPIYKGPLPILSTAAVGPISVGPIGKLGGLAGAPLWTGHSYGGAISTASVIKSASPVIATPVAAAPIIAAPAPLATPVLKAPILTAPVLPAPIVKAPILPAYTSSLLPAAYPAALPVLKAPYGFTGWDNSLLRGPLSTYGLLGDGYLSKGLYTLPALGASWGYPTLGQKYK